MSDKLFELFTTCWEDMVEETTFNEDIDPDDAASIMSCISAEMQNDFTEDEIDDILSDDASDEEAMKFIAFYLCRKRFNNEKDETKLRNLLKSFDLDGSDVDKIINAIVTLE